MSSARYPVIEAEVKSILQYLSGHSLDGVNTAASFFDLGFDSLLLTQASQSFRQKFGVKVTFRQLMEELLSIDAVTASEMRPNVSGCSRTLVPTTTSAEFSLCRMRPRLVSDWPSPYCTAVSK